MKRSKVKGNMLTFRNPEEKTGCIVLILNLLKTGNQRSGAAREQIVTPVGIIDDDANKRKVS